MSQSKSIKRYNHVNSAFFKLLEVLIIELPLAILGFLSSPFTSLPAETTTEQIAKLNQFWSLVKQVVETGVGPVSIPTFDAHVANNALYYKDTQGDWYIALPYLKVVLTTDHANKINGFRLGHNLPWQHALSFKLNRYMQEFAKFESQ